MRTLLAMMLFATALSAAAQLYRWTDESGKTHFGDTPPPKARNVQKQKPAAGAVADTAGLPFALQQAMKTAPITLYTTPGCDLDIARSRMVCGAVPTGAHVSVYLSADTSKIGAFHYGVKVADISGGTTLYVNQNPDGTHQVVSWSEVVT